MSLSSSCPSLLPSVPTSRNNWLGPVPAWRPTNAQVERGEIDTRTFELHCAVWDDDLETIERLISRRGVDIEVLNGFGQTPLFVASYIRQLKSVRLLLLLGADPNGLCEGGYTPMHGAFYSASRRVIALLLEAGGDINATDCWKMTPVDWLYQQSDVRRQNRVLEIVESRRRWPINSGQESSNSESYFDFGKYDDDYYDNSLLEDRFARKRERSEASLPLDGLREKKNGVANATFDDLFDWDHIEERYVRRPFKSSKSSSMSSTPRHRLCSSTSSHRYATHDFDMEPDDVKEEPLRGKNNKKPNISLLPPVNNKSSLLSRTVANKRAANNCNERFLLDKNTEKKKLVKIVPLQKKSTDVKNTQTDADIEVVTQDEPRKKSFVDSANEFARRKKSYSQYQSSHSVETQTNGLVNDFQRVKIKDHFYTDKASIRRRFVRDRLEQEDECDRPRSVIPEAKPLRANEKFLLIKEWEQRMEPNADSAKQQQANNRDVNGRDRKPVVPMPNGSGMLPATKIRPPKHSSPVLATAVKRIDCGGKTRNVARNASDFSFDVEATPLSPDTSEVNVKKLAKRFQFMHNLQLEEKKKDDMYKKCREAKKSSNILEAQMAENKQGDEKGMDTAMSETLAEPRSECDMLEWDDNDLFNTLSQTADDNI